MIEGPNQPRHVLGVRMTPQIVLLVCSLLVVGTLIGLAVLNWLERLG